MWDVLLCFVILQWRIVTLLRWWSRLRQWSIVFLLMNVWCKILRRLTFSNRTFCFLRNVEFTLTGNELECKFSPLSRNHMKKIVWKQNVYSLLWTYLDGNIDSHIYLYQRCIVLISRYSETYSRVYVTFIHILIYSFVIDNTVTDFGSD